MNLPRVLLQIIELRHRHNIGAVVVVEMGVVILTVQSWIDEARHVQDAYLAVLWAMGLESEIHAFADPERDEEGKQLELTRLPQRVRHSEERLEGEF